VACEWHGYLERNSFPSPAEGVKWSQGWHARSGKRKLPDGLPASAGVGSKRVRETRPEQAAQMLGRARGVKAAVQVTKAVEACYHHGQQAEQPTDQHAVGMMMTVCSNR
jgi:hypothetical protein